MPGPKKSKETSDPTSQLVPASSHAPLPLPLVEKASADMPEGSLKPTATTTLGLNVGPWAVIEAHIAAAKAQYTAIDYTGHQKVLEEKDALLAASQ